jgi:exonuclease III
MGELHLVHININGLRGHKTELEVYLRETNPDVLLLNETKLRDQPAPRLSGYRVAAVRNRTPAMGQGGCGGGVAIYTKKELKFADISPDVDDIVAIDLKTAKGSFALVAYYRPPYDNIDFDVTTMLSVTHGFKHWIVAGDFNAKHEHFGCTSTNKAGDQLFDFVEENEVIVANDPDSMTRHVVSTGRSELLDFFLVPRCMSGQLADCFVGEDVGSDHLPLHLKLKTAGNIERYPVRMVRVMARCNWEAYADQIDQGIDEVGDAVEWRKETIEDRCEEIRQCIASAIDTACPLQPVKAGAFTVSGRTLAMIKLKRKLRRKCQKTGDPELRTLYNDLSRQVKEAIAAEKLESWNKATASLDNLNGARLWRKFKMLTGEGASARAVTRVMGQNGELTSSPEATAEAFATHLSKVHTTHEGPEFCASTRLTVEAAVNDRDTRNYHPCFRKVPEELDDHPLVDAIEPGEVASALKSCKTKSSPGPDGITYGMLKQVPLKLLAILAQLYTVCLMVGYFPPRWKAATGVMIAKPGKDGKVVSNYRPISLLSTLGKLFEKVITTRLYRHFGEISFFNQWQRAYLAKKEAAEHIYRLTQSIMLAKEIHWSASVISLDVEKAFDSVWHDGLRYKLSQIGLPVKLVRLLSSFLSDRTISVRVAGELSEPVSLKAGTPQGSVLSPLLYLIYVNDVPINPVTNKCDGGQFADDISLWTLAKSTKVTRLRLQRALRDLELWCSRWRIKLNVAKTQLVRFPKRKEKLELKLFGQTISAKDELTLLGVTFDQKLTFGSHCRLKAKEATRRVGLLRRVSGQGWGAGKRVLLNLYKQYVRPVLEYGNAGIADAAKSNLALLQRVQNSALRTSLRVPRRTRISKLHKLARMDPVPRRLRSLQSRAVTRFGANPLMQSLRDQQGLLGKSLASDQARQPH